MATAVSSSPGPSNQPDSSVTKTNPEKERFSETSKESVKPKVNGNETEKPKPKQSDKNPKEDKANVKKFDNKLYVEAPPPKTNPWKKGTPNTPPPPVAVKKDIYKMTEII
ncbi:hypothetical protein LOTGIDRAFT_158240 [Lottia gigantea]|uniref:Uncharacterized protein n=1 Tax=Lottia gigantea TaxID=225164 RepID=V4B176_LOTGI|nr:hypothetical protein LOTGIDRAFT_158240 [Lottia gigantea]ESP00017.1 hypothetical protein LOTGIDRAFT_158240 [Lottia gigantea]